MLAGVHGVTGRVRRHGLRASSSSAPRATPGASIAERLVAQGARPVLAGRSASAARRSSPSALGGLESVRADVDAPQLASSTLVGAGRRAGLAPSGRSPSGASRPCAPRSPPARTYLDSTGEPRVHPPRVRGVRRRRRERAGARAADRDGLRLRARARWRARWRSSEAGRRAVRVDVGYYALGWAPTSLARGTRESLVGVTLDDGHAFRDGARAHRARRPSACGRSAVKGKPRERDLGRRRRALRAARRPIPRLREVNVYLGWFGPLARADAGRLARRARRRCSVPGVRGALQVAGERLVVAGGRRPRRARRPATLSWIAAEAYDAAGEPLAEVHLAGADAYDFTAALPRLGRPARRRRGVGRARRRGRAGRGVRPRRARAGLRGGGALRALSADAAAA